ncbi:AI-2E family transporter [Halalkalibaculum sp. DA3122]|uniref:AI-2E family transporter n=1 Tax=unclassified Halalkalibaculum TaxID=2964617 RepID=UPI003753FD26
MNNLTLDKIVKFLLGTAAFAAVLMVLYNYSNLLTYAIIAMILSYILDPIVNRMQFAGMNRTVAITLTLSSVILLLVWISTTVIPIIATQMVQLANQLNIETIRNILNQVESRFTENLTFLPEGFLIENVTQILEELFDVGELPTAISNIIDLFTNLFSAFLVIPFATFFFLKDGSKIRRDLLQFVPNKYFETTLSLIDKIETRLGHYFRSVVFQSFLVATSSYIALSVVELNNALSVGISIGIANSIPYFGPIIGYILSIIVSIIEVGDFSLILPCVLAILVVQILDNAVFQPLIFSRSADMHPVAILFIILIGAETAGILGMLIAIPIATIIKITINQFRWSFNNYYIFRAGSQKE